MHFGITVGLVWHHFTILFRHRFLHRFLNAFFQLLAENGSQNDSKSSGGLGKMAPRKPPKHAFTLVKAWFSKKQLFDKNCFRDQLLMPFGITFCSV